MIAFVAIGCTIAYLVLQFIKLLLATVYVYKSRCPSLATRLTKDLSVTIAQPILSGDPLLLESLSRNLKQLPASVRHLWLIDENDLVAQQMANVIAPGILRKEISLASPCKRDVIGLQEERWVEVVLCPPSPADSNPKSFKLAIALSRCNTEYFAVLDDDTVIQEYSLSSAISNLAFSELYTGLPIYRRGANLWSDLVANFVNNNSVLTYLPPLVFFPPVSINGMFYVARTQTLLELDAFARVEKELCDDSAIHKLFTLNGKKIVQGVSQQRIATTIADGRSFARLMHRWCVFAKLLHQEQRFGVQLYMSIFLAFPPILLGLGLMLLMLSLFEGGSSMAVWLVVLLSFRQVMIAASQWIAFGRAEVMSPFLSLIAELLQPVQLVFAFLIPQINWRGHIIRVGQGQRFEKRERREIA